MALVSCPECKQQVSTEAATCPHCGKRLSGIAAAPAPGPVVFAPKVAPGPEQPLWEGRPSAAVLYGQVLLFILRCFVLFLIGYFAITIGLPSLASLSSAIQSFVEQNANVLQLAIAAILVLVLLPSAMLLLQAFARIKNTHYRVTNQRIVIESGVLSRSLEEIDMRSVDDIEFHQTFFERIFGIGQVQVVSADKVAPRLTLYGIHDARKIRELIRSTAYQVSQGQLFTRST